MAGLSDFIGGAVDILGGALNIGGSKSSASSSTDAVLDSVTSVTRFDEESKKTLDRLMQALEGRVAGRDPQFSKQAAISDASGMVNAIFRQYREEELPQIFSAEKQTGGYSSTGAQMLANDAFGEATARSAGVVMDTIQKYAGIQDTRMGLDLDALLQTLQLQGEATVSEDVSSKETSNTSTYGKSRGWGLEF